MALFSFPMALDLVSSPVRLYTKEGQRTLTQDPREESEQTVLIEGFPLLETFMKQGRVIDDVGAGNILNSFLKKTTLRTFTLTKPCILLAVPAVFTQSEREAYTSVASLAGAREVQQVSYLFSLALGVGADIDSPHPTLLLSLGENYSEFGVIVGSSQTFSREISLTLNRIKSEIERFILREYGHFLGKGEASRLISSLKSSKKESISVKGKAKDTHVFASFSVSLKHIQEIIHSLIETMIKEVEKCIESLDPVFASDIIEQGILLSGEVVTHLDIALYASKRLSFPVSMVSQPLDGAILGMKKILPHINWSFIFQTEKESSVLGLQN